MQLPMSIIRWYIIVILVERERENVGTFTYLFAVCGCVLLNTV